MNPYFLIVKALSRSRGLPMIVKLREGPCPALIGTVRLPSSNISIPSPEAEWSCSLDSSGQLAAVDWCPALLAAGPNIEIYVRSENVIILVSSSRNSHTGLIISPVTGNSVSIDIVALLIYQFFMEAIPISSYHFQFGENLPFSNMI